MKYTFEGSLCGGVSFEDTDLTYYIRQHVFIEDLFMLSGEVLKDFEKFYETIKVILTEKIRELLG